MGPLYRTFLWLLEQKLGDWLVHLAGGEEFHKFFILSFCKGVLYSSKGFIVAGIQKPHLPRVSPELRKTVNDAKESVVTISQISLAVAILGWAGLICSGSWYLTQFGDPTQDRIIPTEAFLIVAGIAAILSTGGYMISRRYVRD